MAGMPSILLVDDDPRLTSAMQDYLQANGFIVYTATNGMQALPVAVGRRPSLIIMDVDMPIMNGLQALEMLRTDNRTKTIPVIMLTGVVSEKVYPVVESMPNVSHVKKPVRPEDLLSLIRHYLPQRG